MRIETRIDGMNRTYKGFIFEGKFFPFDESTRDETLFKMYVDHRLGKDMWSDEDSIGIKTITTLESYEYPKKEMK